MQKFQYHIQKNALLLRLLILFVISTISVCIITVLVVVNNSYKAYLTSYEQSNQLLMRNVQEDYEQINNNINLIFDTVSNSAIVETYLTQPDPDGQIILDLQKQMGLNRSLNERTPANLMLIGTNGSSYFQNDNVRNQSIVDFLNSPIIQTINQNTALTQYFYQYSGLTTSTEDNAGLLYVRKLIHDKKTFGYALIFITEDDFSSVYTKLFDKELHDIYVVDNQNQQIISSNQTDLNGKKMSDTKLNNQHQTIMTEIPLYSYDFTFYNVLNQKVLLKNMDLVRPTLIIVISSVLFVSLFAFMTIRSITRPIYHLIDEIKEVRDGNFTNNVQVEGTYETQELAKAYNTMLEDLQRYFEELLESESEKRLIEIQSLQMQIQPHFIYNTLTAIKFLILQGENEKAALAIEHFIVLLRQTLSQTSETITLDEELSSVESYIHILKLRYGQQIQTTIFPSEDTIRCLVPKMIIQPIIENAYLHAFPNQQEGFIHIFTRIKDDDLIIDIIDNGIGFDIEKTKKQHTMTPYYSKIGLKNIKDRIQLLYGDNYGLNIHSESNQGTTIQITLPNNN